MIRQLYPDQKLTTANYKGFQARCEGLLCIGDMTKSETLQYFDWIIERYKLNLQYDAEVYAMRSIKDVQGARFRVESSKGTYEAKVLAVGIGIFGRPNKPKEYRLPPALKERLLFDITSQRIEGENGRWRLIAAHNVVLRSRASLRARARRGASFQTPVVIDSISYSS